MFAESEKEHHRIEAVAFVRVAFGVSKAPCRLSGAGPNIACGSFAAKLVGTPAGGGTLTVDENKIEVPNEQRSHSRQRRTGERQIAGKVTGDAKLETEGKAQKTAGKIQNAVGGIKDSVRFTPGLSFRAAFTSGSIA